MFLIGHAMVAFLIAYFISKRGRKAMATAVAATTTVSFALVMLIGTLPDIDIVLQIIGVIPHKTYTHSLAFSAGISIAIYAITRRALKASPAAALAYALAYAQHMLDDVVIGTLNVAYPFGYLPAGIGIGYGSLYHLVIEVALVAVVTTIVMRRLFGEKRATPQEAVAVPLGFGRIDRASYALLLLSFAVSFAYLVSQMQELPRLFVDTQLEVSLFTLLHVAGMALVSFMAFAAREHARQAAAAARVAE
jgi:hypothetical protein